MQTNKNSIVTAPQSNRQQSGLVLQPAQLVLFSFLFIIGCGTLLLMLPLATVNGQLSFIEALFTSTSATCVTGLTVYDTGSEFTRFGQIVILGLIQLGGLGIMTLSTFFVYLVAGRLSLTGRDIVQSTFSQHPIAELAHLLKLVFITTIVIEAAGAVLLSYRFIATYELGPAIYLGVFHSISAFCNAGFTLFPDSFIAYRDDLFVNGVLSVLIILGGLGFIVVFDLFRNRSVFANRFWQKLQFHTRISLFATVVLLSGGFVLFTLLEDKNTLKELSGIEQLTAAFFQSVTTRTAGFNTLEIGSFSNATLFLLTMLMFIGASPGSCGGGIKSTTFIIIMASVRARFKLQDDVNIFYRRMPEEVVSKAISVLFFSSLIIVMFTMLILITESTGPPTPETRGLFVEYFFEVVSAFGTVGLSTGITSDLSTAGKFLITLLMFIGRLGPLTITLAMKGKTGTDKFKYVKENVLVG